MNNFQKLWWEQSKSDYDMFCLLRKAGAPSCHSLHFLQMVTEKVAKAYFWREVNNPPKSHAGFYSFMRRLSTVRRKERDQVAKSLGFENRFRDFTNWIQKAMPLIHEIERLAPALANDGPNPEYPWPHASPTTSPVSYNFPIWGRLRDDANGRKFLSILKKMIENFEIYA